MKPVYPQNNPQVCPPFSLENQRFALVAHADGGMNKSGQGSATNAPLALRQATPMREVPIMSFEGQYPESVGGINLEQFVTLAAHYAEPIDVEGETLYYMTACLRRIRPSVILGLARHTADMGQFLTCLKLADMAAAYPERAEGLAGEAMDSFQHTEAASADAVYGLIMLTAAQSTFGDGSWERLSNVTRRVVDRVARE